MKRGVFSIYGDWSQFQRLRIRPTIETGYVGVSVEWGTAYSDPLAGMTIDVAEKWLGHTLLRLAIAWDKRRGQ